MYTENTKSGISVLNNESLSEEQQFILANSITSLVTRINSENFDETINEINQLNNSVINDLSPKQIFHLKKTVKVFENTIDCRKYNDGIRYCSWLDQKLTIHLNANEYERLRELDSKKLHPVRPRRGEVYLTNLGENIGKEINNNHLVVIMQNNKGNLYSNTVICIPISSSTKLSLTHEKIEAIDIVSGRLDKLPSKVKTEQIQYLDKARLIHKVAELSPAIMLKICNRLTKNLDIV